jgi:bis(5'-nucleosidyl)-tetraphosphatase
LSLLEEKSIAAVVFFKDEYLLLKYGLGHWGFVKGHVEKEENDEQTIMRELAEETGIINAEIVNGFKQHYDYYYNFKGKRFHKKIHCYLIKAKTKEVKLSYEHVDYTWLSINPAIKKASFKNTKEMLKKAHAFRKSSLDSFLK